MGVLKWIWHHRNVFIILLTPLLLLPLPLVIPGLESRCGFTIILMALYWCTECMPLAVTALLPVVLFPMMGIMESSAVCVEYLKDSNMLFIGGLLVAIAVENWHLHKRIAIRLLLIIGVRPALLMMGFMIVSAFLSMWISNTATTAMMLPIAQAVLDQLSATEARAEERELRAAAQDNQAFELETQQDKLGETANGKIAPEDVKPRSEVRVRFPDEDPDEEWSVDSELEKRRILREEKYRHWKKGMSLSVCYSASIGGTATLTGTTPNIILKGQMDKLFPKNGDIINFTSWFAFAFPHAVLLLAFCWLWLQFMFLGFDMKKSFGCRRKDKERVEEAYAVMKEEHRKLGGVTFAEVAVMSIFTSLVILWFTREPGYMDGWATILFNEGGTRTFVTDGTTAIFMSMLFFIIPSQLPRCGGYGYDEEGKEVKAPPPLLNWQVVHERMPWNIILLLGGGFALAAGSEVSGLSTWLGASLAPLKVIPPYAISFLLCLLVATFTECASNTATTTLFLPILASMAVAIELHPLYVMIPVAQSAGLAFCLPVATPPNAIAFSFGNLRVLDMVKAGFMLNIMGILTINLSINTWGYTMFNLDTFPDWANTTQEANLTLPCT